MIQQALQIEPGLRWYAIQTKLNRERDVEKRLTNLQLEVFLPRMQARRRIGRKFHWIKAPLFPGYVFTRLDMAVSGRLARYAPGVKDFLTFGSQVAEVGEDIIEALRARCPGGVAQIDPVTAKPGDSVRVFRSGGSLRANAEEQRAGGGLARNSRPANPHRSRQREHCQDLALGRLALLQKSDADGVPGAHAPRLS
jgi:hypothetical protein